MSQKNSVTNTKKEIKSDLGSNTTVKGKASYNLEEFAITEERT
jgi:S-DNA-T family DNA segregation ATPase FtsK/SpoIIIE